MAVVAAAVEERAVAARVVEFADAVAAAAVVVERKLRKTLEALQPAGMALLRQRESTFRRW